MEGNETHGSNNGTTEGFTASFGGANMDGRRHRGAGKSLTWDQFSFDMILPSINQSLDEKAMQDAEGGDVENSNNASMIKEGNEVSWLNENISPGSDASGGGRGLHFDNAFSSPSGGGGGGGEPLSGHSPPHHHRRSATIATPGALNDGFDLDSLAASLNSLTSGGSPSGKLPKQQDKPSSPNTGNTESDNDKDIDEDDDGFQHHRKDLETITESNHDFRAPPRHRRAQTANFAFGQSSSSGSTSGGSGFAGEPLNSPPSAHSTSSAFPSGWMDSNSQQQQQQQQQQPSTPHLRRMKSEHSVADIDIDALREQVDSWKGFFSSDNKKDDDDTTGSAPNTSTSSIPSLTSPSPSLHQHQNNGPPSMGSGSSPASTKMYHYQQQQQQQQQSPMSPGFYQQHHQDNSNWNPYDRSPQTPWMDNSNNGSGNNSPSMHHQQAAAAMHYGYAAAAAAAAAAVAAGGNPMMMGYPGAGGAGDMSSPPAPDPMLMQQWMHHYMPYYQQQAQAGAAPVPPFMQPHMSGHSSPPHQMHHPMMHAPHSPPSANGMHHLHHQHHGQHHHQQRGMKKGGGGGGNLGNKNASICPALLEYRTSGRRPTMEELTGHVVEFSRDAHGSRFVQFKMETATTEEKEVLVNEVAEDAISLMQDTFGNYVVQNFMEHATPGQRITLGNTMKGYMVQLSSQAHGCRVVQRAILLLPHQLRNELLSELLMNPEDTSHCSRNSHATHVMQKVVSLIVDEENKRIRENLESDTASPSTADLLRAVERAVALDFIMMSVHPHAYRLVLTVMDDCNPTRSDSMRQILNLLEENADRLAKDQHGNFILQHILNRGTDQQKAMVQKFVADHVVELSQHKFGSHLVEKCLSCASQDQVHQLVQQLISPTGLNAEQSKLMVYNSKQNANVDHDDDSTLLLLMQDPYANFVVQRAFDASQGHLRSQLVHEIKSRSDLLQKFTYGRHILLHIQKQTNGGTNSSSSGSNNNNNNNSSKNTNSTPASKRKSKRDV